MKKIIFILLTCILFAAAPQGFAQTITGSATVCNGMSTTLTGSPAGGTWSSSNPATATVSASGLVSGTTTGTATITYTLPSSAYNTVTVSVNPMPGSISGISSACTGSGATLGNSAPGGIWSSSNVAIASIGATTGSYTGSAAGTSVITYTLPAGCSSVTTITILPLPGAITATDYSVCAGSTLSLHNTSSPSGTWSSASPAIATVSSAGIVTGTSAGNTVISYSLPSGCYSTHAITVNALPATITGASAVCSGSAIILANTVSGGSWSISSPAIATINAATGVVVGVTAGGVAATYMLPTGCFSTKPVSVNAAPAPVSGPSVVCIGASGTFTDATSGGVWGTSSTAVGAIGSTSGIFSGMSAGTTLVTYTLATGCYTTTVVTVSALPAPISAPSFICAGAPAILTSATPGGLWISSSTAVATVGAAAGPSTTLTGISAGTATISYITSASCVTSTIITVTPAPYAGSITGPSVICTGIPASMGATVSGGAWSCSSAIAGITSAGVVTGFSPGIAIVSYSVSSVCGTAVTTSTLSVALPPAAITGPAALCGGATATLTDASAGGIWSISDLTIATIGSSTGMVTGIINGTATVTYAYSSACFVTRTETINPAPAAIGGAGPVCIGAVIALTDALPGGTWASANPAIATISTLGSTTGVVLGVSAGTVFITYAMSTGCLTTAVVTVNSLPPITVAASASSCGGTFLAAAGGGVSYTWSPATGVACDTCASTLIEPMGTTTYTVTGSGLPGCANSATVTLDGNRIYGHITFSGPAPTSLSMQVWLIQYNAADSALTAIDSVTACLDGAVPFYQFSAKPAGSYMVKAKLLSSIAGTSDYVPTYGAATTSWAAAATISHSTSADSQDIAMMYGTVPSGPGFISGNVYSGAGKGTAGDVAVPNMLILLKDAATGQVLTHTYTNSSGAYSFTGIAYGSYLVYPEDFSYYTTPSAAIDLNTSTPGRTAVDFKERTTSGIITPFPATGINTVTVNPVFTLYPNPANGALNIQWDGQTKGVAVFTITDVAGREVYATDLLVNAGRGTAHINTGDLAKGVYFYKIHSEQSSTTGRLILQ